MMWWLVSETFAVTGKRALSCIHNETELSGSLIRRTVGILENKTCEISDTGNCALSYILLEIRRKSQLSDSLTQTDIVLARLYAL